MCTPGQCIFDKLGGLAFDKAIKAGRYVRHYTDNLGKLRVELRDLDDLIKRIRGKVDEAKDRGEEIEDVALHWQTDSDELKNQIGQHIEESNNNADMRCIACSCPNIMWRYRLSKIVEEEILGKAKELRERYDKLGEISHPKPRPPELESLSDKNYVNFDSRATIFKDIVDALKESNVDMIGVFGLGGVGKTTLVKEVGEQMRKDGTFKQVAIAVVSENLNVKEVQSRLAATLNFKFKAEADDQKGRASELWNKFINGDKYLIILDDIWEEVKMEAIGIPCTKEKKSCKVVLTSRNEDLLSTVMEVDRNFSIAKLSSDEAWDLFTKVVGNSIQTQPKIKSLAYEVCKRCEGLPVALKALGEALKNKQEHSWTTALDKMKKYMLTKIVGISPSVLASLRVSYDMLHSVDAKSVFLLCCLFAEDAEIRIDELARFRFARSLVAQNFYTLEEARNDVHTVVDALKSASLLSNGNDENVVRIHDVIRAVGITIAREEEAFLVDHGALRWPQTPPNGPSYSAISLIFKNVKEHPIGLVYPKLQSLMIENSKLLDVQFPDDFFTGMMQLTVLTITRVRMRRLPSSLAKLKNLRMLCLNECELDDITILNDLKSNLEVLSLQGSSIEALPPEIGQVTSLRVLDLQGCAKLKVIPRGVISNLTGLEELYIPKEFDRWGATKNEQEDLSSRDNVSLEELRSSLANGQLTTLHIHVPDGELLPKEDLIFANLKRFRISVGSEFKFWEEYFTRACMLKLEGIQLRNEFIPLVDKSEVLILKPESSVHSLQLFNKLTVLIIKHFKLKHLCSPTTARELVHLEKLEVSYCEIMEGIIGFEGQNDANEITGEVKFSKLKQLDLSNLPNLISFHAKKETMETTMGSSSARAQPLFNEKVIFPVLENLLIEGLGNIINIWDKQSMGVLEKQGSFGKPIDLYVHKCKKLMHVFPSNMHPLIKNLKELHVNNCENMEAIIEVASPTLEPLAEIQEKEEINNDIIVFPQLKKLIFWELPNVKSFYTETQGFFSHKVAFPVLEKLGISYLCKITRIWDSQPLSESEKEAKSFCKLISINVIWCVNLEYVLPFYMLPQLKNLQELRISGCMIMEVIISNNSKDLALLPNIKSLSTDTQLSFFNKVASPALEQLAEIQEKEGINNDIIMFPQLKSVQLQELPELKSFCAETKGFFSHKDVFPVLDKIFVENLGTRKEISIEDENREKIDLQIIEVLQGGNESGEGDSAASSVFHFDAQCDGCDVCPIPGPRFKSIVKYDYDLCSVCFSIMGVPTDYVKRDRPYDSFKRLCDPERSASGEESDPNREAVDEDLEIPNKISMEQATKLWELFLKIFRYGKQYKEACGTNDKVSDNSDEPADEDLELFMNVISMKRANAWWKMYLQIFRNGKQSKEECGTSGKESHDHNGEEFDEDLVILMNEISMEDALTVLRKIYFENIQNMMESKGLTFPLSLDWECGTSSKENDHNGEKFDEDLETPTNEISMEDALTVLGKIFENIYGKEKLLMLYEWRRKMKIIE